MENEATTNQDRGNSIFYCENPKDHNLYVVYVSYSISEMTRILWHPYGNIIMGNY